MAREQDSLLPLVAQVEQEIEALLSVTRKEAEDIVSAARREAADRVRAERARLPEAEQETYAAVLASGERYLGELRERAAVESEALHRRIEEQMEHAVQAVLEVVRGEPLS